MDGPAGGYVPTVRGGGKMRVRMICLGRHWNPLAREAGFAFTLDLCILSFLLESGDAFVFGGPARFRYHGVSRIIPGTAPAELGIEGRL